VSARLFLAAILAASLPLLASGQTESDFYAIPKTAPEFWRATQFEIRTGNFERAAERIKGLLDLNPDDKTLFDLVDKPTPGTQGGMAQFLRLRNVPRWNALPNADKESKARVEELIAKLTKAVETELSNPDRIRRYANNLSGPPEEAGFALTELRRSGKAVPPVLAGMLTEKSPEDVRAGILGSIPLLPVDTVPGFVAFLPAADALSQADLIDALRARNDFRTLPLSAETDPVPTLWFLWGNPATSDVVKTKAKDAIAAATLKDPTLERDSDLRTAQGQLTAYARRFYDGTSNLAKLAGDAKNERVHNVWTWDGKVLKEVPMSRTQATEYYGLRYARWALDLQSDYEPAQKVFLGLAIETQAARAGAGRNLARSAPDLHAALATAPFELLADLLQDGIRQSKTAVVLAVVRVLGERTEPKASRPTGDVGGKAGAKDPRPALLVRALDYADPRVQFAAADALLRIPGASSHGRNTQIVKILAATLAGDPVDNKQKALLADPDHERAEAVAAVLQRSGFDVVHVRNGRDMMRRLHQKADVDLVMIDRHIPDPMLPDLLAQVRADFRGKTLPVLVLASADGIAPVHLLTVLARLAVVTAFEDLPANTFFDFAPHQKDSADKLLISHAQTRQMLIGRKAAQVKRMQDVVEKAGFALSAEMTDLIDYFSLQTFSPEILQAFAPQLVQEERIVVRRLLPPLVLEEAGDSPVSALKSRIRFSETLSSEEVQRVIRLMKLTAGYESAIPQDRLVAMEELWKAFRDPASPRIPQTTLIRDPIVEAKLVRVSAPYRGVHVVPAVFTEAGFQDALAQATDVKAPLISPAEKKENARTAMVWLRKMAVGEVPGYKIADAEAALRGALRSDELAPLAIDALVRLPSKEVQLDLANLSVAPERPIPLRTQAATALVEHMQTFGKFVTGPQTDAIVNSAAATDDADLKGRLLAAQGVLRATAKGTGDRLKLYVPKPGEAPKEEVVPPKDEPKKDDPKENPAEKKG
jgi:CheY-like chemotaxis protein